MRTKPVLNSILLIVVLASLIAPMVVPLEAQAQGVPYIKTSRDPDRLISRGANVTVYIYHPNATAPTIEVTVTVAGTPNTVTFYRNVTSGEYVGVFEVTATGTVIYHKYNATIDDFQEVGPLAGQFTRHGQRLVVETTIDDTVLRAELIFVEWTLVVHAREYPAGSRVYWIPRLCCNFSDYYNPYEWYIVAPGATVGQDYNVTLFINDLSLGISWNTTIVFTAVEEDGLIKLVPKNDTEAAKITALLTDVTTVSMPWYIDGADFSAVTLSGSEIEMYAQITGPGLTEPVTTIISWLRPFVSIARIEISQAVLYDPIVTVLIYDADMNFNSTEAETLYPPYLFWIEDVDRSYTPVETGPSTGVFVVYINLLMDGLYPGAFNEEDNTIYWNFTEIRIDDCTQCPPTVVCFHKGSFKVQYHPATFNIVEEEVVLREAQRCCPVQKITLEIEDMDLNVAYTPVAVATIPAGSLLYEITAYYKYKDPVTGEVYTTSVPALSFSVYLKGVNAEGEEKLYNVTTTDLMAVTFRKVDGKIVAEIDLSKVNWGAVNAMATAEGYTLTHVVVYYTDIFSVDEAGNVGPQVLVDSVAIQAVKLEVSRDTLPVAFRETGGIVGLFQDYVLGGEFCPVQVRGETAQVVEVTLYDNGTNINCCEVETVPRSNIELTLKKYSEQVDDIVVYASDSGHLHVPLVDEANNTIGMCYFELTDLVETGIDTGVFTGELRVYSIVNGVPVAGCPSLWLEGAVLELYYVSPSIGDASVSIKFEVMGATLEVSSTEVKFGESLTITITDPDANLALDVNETTYLQIGFQCPGVTGFVIAQQCIGLEAVNETANVYETTIIVDSTFVNQPCQILQLYYEDRTPRDPSTLTYAEGELRTHYIELGKNPVHYLMVFLQEPQECPTCPLPTQLIQEVQVRPDKGEISLYYRIEVADISFGWQDVTNRVVPLFENTTVRIVVKDSDQNKLATSVDTLDGGFVRIQVGTVSKTIKALFGTDLVETDVSTGEFYIDFTLGELASLLGFDSVYALAGETIIVTYYDPQATCIVGVCGAGAATVVANVTVVDITGELLVVDTVTGEEKDTYQCYCPIPGCPQPGDAIDIIVRDITLLPYAGKEIAFDDFFEAIRIADGVEMPPVAYEIPNLTYQGYNNITIQGVVIPVPEFAAGSIRLGCGIAPPDARYYIVVGNIGEALKIVYYDSVGATFAPETVSKTFGIGAPVQVIGLPEETISYVEAELKILAYRAGQFVETDTITRGEAFAVNVAMSYDPNILSIHLGAAEQFLLIYFLEDAAGNIVAFGFKPVPAGTQTTTIEFAATATAGLEPGTYTIRILAVNNLDELVSLSRPVQITFTITE